MFLIANKYSKYLLVFIIIYKKSTFIFKFLQKKSRANPGIEPGSHAPEACILPVD